MKNLIIIPLLFFTACNFEPELKHPKINSNKNWDYKNKKLLKNSDLIDNWWKILNDKDLNKLVADGLKHNHDVKIGVANIEISRLENNISNLGFFPDFNYNLDGTKTKYSGDSNSFNQNRKINQFDSSFDLSWEIDFFGKVRNANKSSKYEYLSKIDQKKAVSISVSSEIIKNYIELRSYQKLEEKTKENIKLLQQTIDLTKLQENVGIATNFDVQRANSQKEIIEATLPNIKAEIFSRIYKISVLIGKNPSYLKERLIKNKKLPVIIDPINIGLPSQIIQRRPDIKAAQNLMIAKNAQIGVRIAEFFPSISLTGSLGNSSRKFSDLFLSNSRNWQYGFDINLPILGITSKINEYKITKEEQKITIINYEKTILNAFMEVETSLVKYGKEIQTRNRLKKAVKNNRKIVDIAQQRYKAGLDDILDVIDAKRNLIEVQNSLIESEARILTNLTALFKALGGSIKSEEELVKEKNNKPQKKNFKLSVSKD